MSFFSEYIITPWTSMDSNQQLVIKPDLWNQKPRYSPVSTKHYMPAEVNFPARKHYFVRKLQNRSLEQTKTTLNSLFLKEMYS